ncbi:uncharacterized protein [Nicotiana tomentosiformis]|uniref:uncharacterized protein n=1 Tax=Nicotiana tomentosiformis TaxID=4098 RepID=UPI00388C55C7
MTDDEQRRLERFGRLQPPSFSGAESEDAHDFLDRCHRILHTAGILETIGVSFTTVQFTGVAFRWWDAYERCRPVGAAPLIWHEFPVLFLEKCVPQTRRDELRRQFEESVSGATFDEVVDIARRLEMVLSQEREERDTKRTHGSGGFSGVPYGGQSYHSRGLPYRPTQMSHHVHRGASFSHGSYNARLGQSSLNSLPVQSSSCAPSAYGSSASGSSSSYSGSRACLSIFHHFPRGGCFECGELGHLKKFYPRLMGGPAQHRSQAMTSAPVTSPLAQLARGRAQAARGRPRRVGRSSGSQAQFYAILSRPDAVLQTQ